MSRWESLIRSSIRSMATTRKKPTPTATARINVMLGMPGTCSAKTWRSGSDMVMKIPTSRLTSTIIHTLRDLVTAEPTWFPMGVMARSVPRVKSPIPRISITAPRTKPISRSLGTGEMVKHSKKTIPVTGSTEEMDSFSFSIRMVRFFSSMI